MIVTSGHIVQFLQNLSKMTGQQADPSIDNESTPAILFISIAPCIVGLVYFVFLVLFLWTSRKKRSIIGNLHYRYIINGVSSGISPTMIVICLLKLLSIGLFLGLIAVTLSDGQIMQLKRINLNHSIVLFLGSIPKHLTPIAIVIFLSILVNELIYEGTQDGAFDHIIYLRKLLIGVKISFAVLILLNVLMCALVLISQAVAESLITASNESFNTWMTTTYHTIFAYQVIIILTICILTIMAIVFYRWIKKSISDVQTAPLNPEYLRKTIHSLIKLIISVAIIGLILAVLHILSA